MNVSFEKTQILGINTQTSYCHYIFYLYTEIFTNLNLGKFLVKQISLESRVQSQQFFPLCIMKKIIFCHKYLSWLLTRCT